MALLRMELNSYYVTSKDRGNKIIAIERFSEDVLLPIATNVIRMHEVEPGFRVHIIK